MTQPALLPTFAVHCFFGWCSHVVHGFEPRAAHDDMELHYRAVHGADIQRLIPGLPRWLERDIAGRSAHGSEARRA